MNMNIQHGSPMKMVAKEKTWNKLSDQFKIFSSLVISLRLLLENSEPLAFLFMPISPSQLN